MEQIMSHSWTHAVEAAFCEFDPKRLIERVGLAEAAISSSMNYQTISTHPQERQLMAHGLLALVLLRSSTSPFVSSEPEDGEDDENEEPKEKGAEEETSEGYSE